MAAPNSRKPFISVSVSNTSTVKAMLDSAAAAATFSFSRGRLEQLILRRHRERFDELGSNENAQQDPEGNYWQELAPSTLKNHPNPNQILTRKDGRLRRSVQIVRSRMGALAVQTNTGGGFRIGVPSSSPAGAFAEVHQKGGISNGSFIPARPFLGISDRDVDAVDRFVERNFLKYGIRSN